MTTLKEKEINRILSSDIQSVPMAYCMECGRQTIQVKGKCKHCSTKGVRPVSSKKIFVNPPLPTKPIIGQPPLIIQPNSELDFECRYCGRRFIHYTNLLEHRGRCKNNPRNP